MAAEVLSFQKEEGKTAYYATFVSDGNPVTIQIKNKGGMVTVFANIEGMKPGHCILTCVKTTAPPTLYSVSPE